MVRCEALLRHEVLVEVVGDATSTRYSISWKHLSAESRPALLLRDRPLVQIARLEELVCGGEPVMLRSSRLLLLALAILLLGRLHLNIIARPIVIVLPERRGRLSCRGALRCTVSHLVDVRSELLS